SSQNRHQLITPLGLLLSGVRVFVIFGGTEDLANFFELFKKHRRHGANPCAHTRLLTTLSKIG
ncbi:MAG: hypothetical protein KGL63_07265, partial [Betaproteobacteria bacterium]|nr:hypothetical protein [Betaproteobacteria bacterium]